MGLGSTRLILRFTIWCIKAQTLIAGPCSAITGPADEFGPIGWDDAKAGGKFVKIAVGALRRQV
jgi:hypothetical protein